MIAPAELPALVASLAAHRELWQDGVRHDADRRVFVRVVAEEHFEAWLICWMPGQDTGFHDHDLSSGAVTVLSGEVCEDRLVLGGGHATARYRAGETFTFSPRDIHRVRHAGDVPATTLHVYSPPLRRMGRYVVAPGRALERHPVAGEEELRPLEVAPAA